MSPDANTWLAQVPWVPLGVIAAVVLLWLVSSTAGKKQRAALADKIAAGAQIIDVRTKGEYAGGHFPGAVNIPVDALSGQIKKLGALDRPLVVYCASGGRSAQAAGILKAAGFTDVTNAGGLSSMPR
jgi:phage shock protein E